MSKASIPTLDDAVHPLWSAASAALLVGNGRQSGKAMVEAVQAIAKCAPILAVSPNLLASLKETLRMLEAAHRSLGMWVDDNPRIVKARKIIAQAESKTTDMRDPNDQEGWR